MKNVLKTILLIFIILLFLGFFSSIKTDKKTNIKDKIDEVEIEKVELYELTIYSDEMDDIIIKYEDGMTWGEWISSKYNTYGFYSKDYLVCLDNYMLLKLSNHSTVEKNNSIMYESYTLSLMAEEVELYELTIDCSNIESMDDITIQYEDGMTWGEWLGSQYNIYGFTSRFMSTGMSGVYLITLDEYKVSISIDGPLVTTEHLIEFDSEIHSTYILTILT